MTRTLLAAALLLSLPALADKADKKGGEDFTDLFGDSLSGGTQNLDDLKKATSEVKVKETKRKGLGVKNTEGDEHAKIEFIQIFAAQKIKMSRKEGCIPADAGRTRLAYLAFDELPEQSDPFAVCLSIKSKIGRELRVTTRIVDERNKRIGKGNDVIDFRGKVLVHHVLDFPALTFPHEGKYFYAIEIDGKQTAKLPLFEVKLLPQEE